MWADADTRLEPSDLFKQNIDRELRCASWGGASLLKTFLHIWKWYQKAPWGDIQELRDLMRMHPIGRKVGTAIYRISKQLIYGGNQMPETQIKSGGRRSVRGTLQTKERRCKI